MDLIGPNRVMIHLDNDDSCLLFCIFITGPPGTWFFKLQVPESCIPFIITNNVWQPSVVLVSKYCKREDFKACSSPCDTTVFKQSEAIIKMKGPPQLMALHLHNIETLPLRQRCNPKKLKKKHRHRPSMTALACLNTILVMQLLMICVYKTNYLLSYHRENFQLNSIKLVKTCPCTTGCQTFKKLSK